MSRADDISPRNERGLQRAVKYVGDYWLPVNQGKLTRILLELDAGGFDNDRDRLVGEIQSDVGLFTGALRGIAELLRERGTPLGDLPPYSALQQSSLEDLKTILKVQQEQAGRHSLEDSSSLQIQRFAEVLTSASACTTLAESYNVSPDAAFASAVLRQLGYALIAWNYPGVYQQCIAALQGGGTLEEQVISKLGFSPITLAVRVLADWGLSDSAIANCGLADPEHDEEAAVIAAIGGSLRQVAEVGEALARANAPGIYPSATRDWSFARQAIEDNLGAEGLELIREQFAELCEHYLTFLPQLFQPALVFSPGDYAAIPPAEFIDAPYNPFIASCDPEVARLIEQAYQRRSEGAATRDLLQHFTRELLPTIGADACSISTVDVGTQSLVPHLTTGSPQALTGKPIPCSLSASANHILAVAYSAVEPVVGFFPASGDPQCVQIAAAFGRFSRLGVLYVELPSHVIERPRSNHITHIQAARVLLGDILSA